MTSLQEQAAAILQRCPVVVLASIGKDGCPRPVPMCNIKTEGTSVIWMATGADSRKAEDFRNDPHAGLCCQEGGNSIVLTGSVEIVADQDLKRALWRDPFIDHFPGGPDDPNYILLQFRSSQATYWIDGAFVRQPTENPSCHSFDIRALPALHTVCLRHVGAFNAMQPSFRQLLQWASARGLVHEDSQLMSVFLSNPETTTENALQTDACLIVDAPLETDGGITCRTIPAGRYAVGRFELDMADFPTAWQTMFGMVQANSLTCTGPPFEIYRNRIEDFPCRKWVVDIHIPVGE